MMMMTTTKKKNRRVMSNQRDQPYPKLKHLLNESKKKREPISDNGETTSFDITFIDIATSFDTEEKRIERERGNCVDMCDFSSLI